MRHQILFIAGCFALILMSCQKSIVNPTDPANAVAAGDKFDASAETVVDTTSQPSGSIGQGLVSFYPFDGGSASDFSNFSNNAILPAGVTFKEDRFNRPTSSLQLLSNNEIVATTKVQENPQVLSYSLWFKTTSPGQFIGFDNGQFDHAGQSDRSVVINENGYITYTVNQGSNQSLSNNTNLMDNKWHHCVVTMNSNGSSIYVDGVLAAKNANLNYAKNYNGWWRIGGLQRAATNPVISSNTGNIDDVRIYDRVLSDNEIAYLSTEKAVTLVKSRPL